MSVGRQCNTIRCCL